MAWGASKWLRREGQSLVIVALMLPLLIGMAGAGVTVGTVYYSQAQLQNAVDAAALAGAKAMSAQDSGAPQDQSSIITSNDPGATSVSVSVSPSNAHLVVATATAQVPGGFASLFGHRIFTITAKASALASPGDAFNYAVFQGDTNPSGPPLLLNGNPTILSANGAPTAAVHSNNKLELNGNVTVEGSCGGDPSVSVGGNSDCTGGIIQPAAQVPMPQWTPAEVSPSSATTVGSSSNPIGMEIGDNSSGNYIVYGNLTIDGNATVNGHFLVYNGNIIVTGNASITGSMVTFGGGILLNGNVTQSGGGSLALAAFTSNDSLSSEATSPGSYNPPYPGAIELNGNINVSSVLYAPDSYIDLNGNITVDGAAVGYTVALNGNVSVVEPTTVSSVVPVQQVTLVQ